MYVSGFDQRLSDSVGGCRRLLQSVKCYRLCCQCGERPSLHQTSRPDYAQKHPGYKKSPRDPQRQRKHLGIHAGPVHEYITSHCFTMPLIIIAPQPIQVLTLYLIHLQVVLDEATTAWGIKVERVEM